MSLNTAVIYGSARKNREGIKAARFVVRKLEDRAHAVTLIDTQEHELPFLDRMYKEFEPGQAPDAMVTVGKALKSADGFVIVSAEYNHSVPSALKNLLADNPAGCGLLWRKGHSPEKRVNFGDG